MSIDDIPELRRLRGVLEAALNARDTALFKSIDELGRTAADAFLASAEPAQLFVPTRDRCLEELRSFAFVRMLVSRLQRFNSHIDTLLASAASEEKDFKSGAKKNELTEWWLKYIEDETNYFLQKHGYDFDTVPDDYTSEPPRDLQAVKDNLELIKEMLDWGASDIYAVQPFVARLKSTIYPAIDRYIASALHLLADHLGLHLSASRIKAVNGTGKPAAGSAGGAGQAQGGGQGWAPGGQAFDLNRLDELFDEQRKTLPAESVAWMSSMIADLRYLTRMKELEAQLDEGTQEKVLDIVPVSGLVIGNFVRLENELKTVLELWDPSYRSAHAVQLSEKRVSVAAGQRVGDTGAKDAKGGDVAAADAQSWREVYVFKSQATKLERILNFGAAGMQDFRQLVAGSYHFLLLTEAGEVYSWGKGVSGQLGLGAAIQSHDIAQPLPADRCFGGQRVRLVAAGGAQSGAITEKREVYWWGFMGVQGDRFTDTPRLVPELSPAALGGRTVLRLAMGAIHALALLDDGSLFAWGANGKGQLGLGHTNDVPSPAPLSLANVRNVCAGEFHSVAVTAAHQVYAWGRNEAGMLGLGAPYDTPEAVLLPQRFMDLPPILEGAHVAEVACGSKHTVLLFENGRVFIWGNIPPPEDGPPAIAPAASSPNLTGGGPDAHRSRRMSLVRDDSPANAIAARPGRVSPRRETSASPLPTEAAGRTRASVMMMRNSMAPSVIALGASVPKSRPLQLYIVEELKDMRHVASSQSYVVAWSATACYGWSVKMSGEEAMPRLIEPLVGKSVQHVAAASTQFVAAVKHPVFGAPLARAMPAEDTVPELVQRLVEALSTPTAIATNGLFSQKGSNDRLTEMRTMINSGRLAELRLASEDPHNVAALLKLYLRSLPEPLMTNKFNLRFLRRAESDEIQKMEIIRNLCCGLPPRNRTLLKYLVTFFAEIAKHVHVRVAS